MPADARLRNQRKAARQHYGRIVGAADTKISPCLDHVLRITPRTQDACASLSVSRQILARHACQATPSFCGSCYGCNSCYLPLRRAAFGCRRLSRLRKSFCLLSLSSRRYPPQRGTPARGPDLNVCASPAHAAGRIAWERSAPTASASLHLPRLCEINIATRVPDFLTHGITRVFREN